MGGQRFYSLDRVYNNYLISLAGLFHGIGKFYQLAVSNGGREFDDKNDFGYLDAFYSHRAITEELIDGLEAVFDREEIDRILVGVYYHKPKSKEEELFQKANWISSSGDKIDIRDELVGINGDILRSYKNIYKS